MSERLTESEQRILDNIVAQLTPAHLYPKDELIRRTTTAIIARRPSETNGGKR